MTDSLRVHTNSNTRALKLVINNADRSNSRRGITEMRKTRRFITVVENVLESTIYTKNGGKIWDVSPNTIK